MAAEPGDKEIVAKALAHWRQDADLAGSRDLNEPVKLPEAERAAFRTLWADLDGLLAKAGAGK
jgi:hypothetical protein